MSDMKNITNKIPPLTAPVPLPTNFKRIPAMIQGLANRNEILRKASQRNLRVRSESHQNNKEIVNIPSHASKNSFERTKTVKDYKMGRQIGKGAFAIVKLVIDKTTKEQQAMKIYDKYKLTDPARRKSVTREIAIMKRISHQNIVQMHTSFDNPHSIYIIMEHVKGKSLYHYLKEKSYRRLPEEEAKAVIIQIAEAIQYIHSLNVAHRDLKLENLIINTATK